MSDPLSIAYYATGHGLGHATRVVEVCKYLVAAGHSVVVVTGAKPGVFIQGVNSVRLSFRKAVLDSGALQTDALTVDMKGSLDEYARTANDHRETILETEAAWLKATHMNLVVSDVVPIACAAAARAGLPSVCVSNFSWDFVYSEYLMNIGGQQSMVWQIADDYNKATCLLRLPGYSPMPAFRKVVDVPLVVRKAQRSPAEVRAEYGLAEGAHVVLFMFGGQFGGKGWKLHASNLPEGWTCLVSHAAVEPSIDLPHNFVLAPPDAYIPDLVNASDCVIGKIGYGAVSECLAHSKPLIFVRRDYFNEEPFLRKLLEVNGAAVEMKRKTFLDGHWAAYMEHALSLRPHYKEPTNGAEVAAELIEEIGRQQEGWMTHAHQDSHLMDTVVWGYLMRAAASRQAIDVPEWYLRGGRPSGLPEQRTFSQELKDVLWERCFTCEHGAESLSQCPDTQTFLSLLGTIADSPASKEHEIRAAQSLFRWEDDLVVTRAPGRLDVMGGIADYSGSLVLQLPLSEACHVAAQVQPLGKQRLWRHMEAELRACGKPKPAIRVVSMGSDHTNRAPTFDMYFSDLQTAEGLPLPYEAARKLFRRDPAQMWAAYVVGCILVLMAEKGAKPWEKGGLSLLVQSEVPEGKGVSSSAALEVSTMMALCQLYDIQLEGRELALLSQKVENLVVGAPCGVMDQMTSAIGRSEHLMVMLCQPAEVQEFLPLPPHIAVWGIDSGIRHSVVGADYGSVRVGTFMGLKITSINAAAAARALEEKRNSQRPPKAKRLSQDAGSLHLLGDGFLANISPSKFDSSYDGILPDHITGSQFCSLYGDHLDTSTQVDPEATYAVRRPTAHPVKEHFRVQTFIQVMSAPKSEGQMRVLGELMGQSHAAYSALGLGSEGTDKICSLVEAHRAQAAASDEEPSLFGAKITGGGSGGTVCVLGSATPAAEEATKELCVAYRAASGHNPKCFRGSSFGAVEFGHLVIHRLKQHD